MDDVEFSPEDATRTDPDFLCKIVAAAIEAGATVINLPDTVGYCVPDEYGAMFRRLCANGFRTSTEIMLSSHCHDDLGMAVANSWRRLKAGARQIECTINGIGERAGNAALEEIAAAMLVRRDKYPLEHDLQLDQLYPTSQLLAESSALRPLRTRPLWAAMPSRMRLAFISTAVLSNPLTYEIMTPASVGVPAQPHGAGQTFGPPRAGAPA